MSELWPEPDLAAFVSLWLGGLLLALTHWARRPRLEAAVALLLAGFAGLALAGGQPVRAWLPAAALAAASLLGMAWHQCGGRLRRLLVSAPARAAIFLIAGPLLASAWVLRGGDSDPDFDFGSAARLDAEAAPALDPAPRSALTDRGRSIPIFTRPELGERASQAEQRMTAPFALALIRTAGPDHASNCHGWVFAGGKYWVRGGCVESILEDNDYQKVEQPQVGDVVVYRDEEGEVTHTGLVRVASEGLLLVESKWGFLGRYLHTPAEQPYGQSWAFFRTPRDGHVLHLNDPDSPGDSIEAPVTSPP
jgi:hypothetical protein